MYYLVLEKRMGNKYSCPSCGHLCWSPEVFHVTDVSLGTGTTKITGYFYNFHCPKCDADWVAIFDKDGKAII